MNGRGMRLNTYGKLQKAQALALQSLDYLLFGLAETSREQNLKIL